MHEKDSPNHPLVLLVEDPVSYQIVVLQDDLKLPECLVRGFKFLDCLYSSHFAYYLEIVMILIQFDLKS